MRSRSLDDRLDRCRVLARLEPLQNRLVPGVFSPLSSNSQISGPIEHSWAMGELRGVPVGGGAGALESSFCWEDVVRMLWGLKGRGRCDVIFRGQRGILLLLLMAEKRSLTQVDLSAHLISTSYLILSLSIMASLSFLRLTFPFSSLPFLFP